MIEQKFKTKICLHWTQIWPFSNTFLHSFTIRTIFLFLMNLSWWNGFLEKAILEINYQVANEKWEYLITNYFVLENNEFGWNELNDLFYFFNWLQIANKVKKNFYHCTIRVLGPACKIRGLNKSTSFQAPVKPVGLEHRELFCLCLRYLNQHCLICN